MFADPTKMMMVMMMAMMWMLMVMIMAMVIMMKMFLCILLLADWVNFQLMSNASQFDKEEGIDLKEDPPR